MNRQENNIKITTDSLCYFMKELLPEINLNIYKDNDLFIISNDKENTKHYGYYVSSLNFLGNKLQFEVSTIHSDVTTFFEDYMDLVHTNQLAIFLRNSFEGDAFPNQQLFLNNSSQEEIKQMNTICKDFITRKLKGGE